MENVHVLSDDSYRVLEDPFIFNIELTGTGSAEIHVALAWTEIYPTLATMFNPRLYSSLILSVQNSNYTSTTRSVISTIIEADLPLDFTNDCIRFLMIIWKHSHFHWLYVTLRQRTSHFKLWSNVLTSFPIHFNKPR